MSVQKVNHQAFKSSAKGKECANKKCAILESERKFRRSQPICLICENDPDVVYDRCCSRCGELRLSTNYRKNRTYCLDCERADGRNYRRTTTKAKEWHENNREHMAQLQKNWYEEHKTEIRAKEGQRYKEDPIFKEVKRYRTSVATIIRLKNSENEKLAISGKLFLEWLEFCFEDGMTWENHYDHWQIDHVLPLDLIKGHEFVTDKSCIYAWYNIMPCTSERNRKKNKFVVKDQVLEQLAAVRVFCKKKNIKINTEYNVITQKFLDAKVEITNTL